MVDDTPALTPKVCTDPACTIKRKPGRPMHGPHDFRAAAFSPPVADDTPTWAPGPHHCPTWESGCVCAPAATEADTHKEAPRWPDSSAPSGATAGAPGALTTSHSATASDAAGASSPDTEADTLRADHTRHVAGTEPGACDECMAFLAGVAAAAAQERTEADTLRAEGRTQVTLSAQDVAEAFANLDEARVEVLRLRAALADRDATIARVEALCAEWEKTNRIGAMGRVRDLRAALTPEATT